MKDINENKVNLVDSIDATDENSKVAELKNTVTTIGQTLSTPDNFQVSKAMATYAAVGAFYSESGAANVYVASVVASREAPFDYVEGMEVSFFAANDNTGASTINVAGLGVKTILREDGVTALVSADILTTQLTKLLYDGTNFRLISRSLGFQALSQPINLIIQNNTGTPVSQMDIDADEVALDGGTTSFRAENVNLTMDLTSNGLVNGTEQVTETGTYSTSGTAVTGAGTAFNTEFVVGDVIWSDAKGEARRITLIGGATSMTLESAFGTDVSAGETVKRGGEAPNTHYHLYVTFDDTTVGSFSSTRDDGSTVTFPAGVTFFRRVGPCRNDASLDLLNSFQFGDQFFYDEDSSTILQVLNNGSETSFGGSPDVDCSALVPSNVRIGRFDCISVFDDNGVVTTVRIFTRPKGSSVASGRIIIETSTDSTGRSTNTSSIEQNLDTDQIFQYRWSQSGAANNDLDIYCNGFVYPF